MTTARKPSGSRQRIWDSLKSPRPLTVKDIVELSKSTEDTVYRYISALKKAGYAVKKNGHWILVNDTGPIAPQINSKGHTNDYNLSPVMTSKELKLIVENSGLSIRQFAITAGLSDGLSTRIRQMCNGQRTVSKTVENAAKKISFDKTL